MKAAILVNGVPASGKSMVAGAVSTMLGCPLLTLDAIKEPFYEHLGSGDREHNRRLGRASYAAIFGLIRDFPDLSTTVIDAWFGFQPAEVLEAHLAMGNIGRTVEIWCHAPSQILAERYRARLAQRPVGHPGEDYIPELVALNDRAAPLRRGPLVEVDTTEPLRLDELMAWIAPHLR